MKDYSVLHNGGHLYSRLRSSGILGGILHAVCLCIRRYAMRIATIAERWSPDDQRSPGEPPAHWLALVAGDARFVSWSAHAGPVAVPDSLAADRGQQGPQSAVLSAGQSATPVGTRGRSHQVTSPPLCGVALEEHNATMNRRPCMTFHDATSRSGGGNGALNETAPDGGQAIPPVRNATPSRVPSNSPIRVPAVPGSPSIGPVGMAHAARGNPGRGNTGTIHCQQYFEETDSSSGERAVTVGCTPVLRESARGTDVPPGHSEFHSRGRWPSLKRALVSRPDTARLGATMSETVYPPMPAVAEDPGSPKSPQWIPIQASRVPAYCLDANDSLLRHVERCHANRQEQEEGTWSV